LTEEGHTPGAREERGRGGVAWGGPGPLDALHDGAQAARRHHQRPCMGARGVHKMYKEFAHPNMTRKMRNECQLQLETSLIRGW